MEHPFAITKNGKLAEKKDQFLSAGRVVVPEFEIYQNPTIRISDVKARRFNLIDRVNKQIQTREDDAIFRVLDALGSGNNTE